MICMLNKIQGQDFIYFLSIEFFYFGEVAEWLKAPAWKACSC
jgi:hypothetical protein